MMNLLAFKLSDLIFISVLIPVKMPKAVGILTVLGMLNCILIYTTCKNWVNVAIILTAQTWSLLAVCTYQNVSETDREMA